MNREEKIELLRQAKQRAETAPQPMTREEKLAKLKAARAVEPEAKEKSTAGQAALQSFGSGLTLGYAPSLQAAVEKPLAKLYDFATGSKVADTISDDYVERRDSWAKRQKDLAEKNPGISLAGNLAGGVVSGIAAGPLLGAAGKAARAIPGAAKLLPAAKTASTLGQAVRKAAQTGATYGALQNPGDIEGQESGLQLPQRIENAAFGAAVGGAVPIGFAGLQATGKGAVTLAKAVKNGTVKGAEQIQAAAKQLGVKLTPGMTSDSMAIRGLESTLEQSPTIGGALMRRDIAPLREGFRRNTETLMADKTSLSPDEVGRKIKDGILTTVDERLKPSKALFDSVRESTKNIPPNQKSLDRVVQNISRIPEVRLDVGGGAGAKASGVLKRLGEAKSIDDLKVIRSQVGALLKEAETNRGPDFVALSKIYDKLGNLEESNLLRGGIEMARAGGVTKGKAEQATKQLVNDLKTAKKGFGTEAKALRQFADQSGLPASASKSPSLFTGAVSDLQNEKVAKKLFDTGNVEGLKAFEKQFPNEFDMARRSYLSELAKKSDFNGEASGAKFLQAIKDMQPAVRKMIFGEGGSGKVDALQTIKNAMPERIGPSGTPQGTAFQQTWNPMQQISGLANYGAYRAITSPRAQAGIARTEAIGKLLESSPALAKLAKTNPKAFSAMATRLFAGDNFEEQKDDEGALDRVRNQR